MWKQVDLEYPAEVTWLVGRRRATLGRTMCFPRSEHWRSLGVHLQEGNYDCIQGKGRAGLTFWAFKRSTCKGSESLVKNSVWNSSPFTEPTPGGTTEGKENGAVIKNLVLPQAARVCTSGILCQMWGHWLSGTALPVVSSCIMAYLKWLLQSSRDEEKSSSHLAITKGMDADCISHLEEAGCSVLCCCHRMHWLFTAYSWYLPTVWDCCCLCTL